MTPALFAAGMVALCAALCVAAVRAWRVLEARPLRPLEAWVGRLAAVAVMALPLLADAGALGGVRGGGKESGVTPWLIHGRTVNHFGDSITKATTGPTTGRGYPTIMAYWGSITSNNLGVDGDQAADLSDDVLPVVVYGRDLNTIMVGANDQRTYLTDADKLTFYKDALRAHLVWLGVTHTMKTLGTTTTGTLYKPTYTGGGWAATDAWSGTEYGKNTTTSAESVSIPVYGTTVYLTTISQYNAAAYTSNYAVTIDGNAVGTFDLKPGNNANITTVNAKTYGERCHRFSGLSSGAHTMVVTRSAGTGPLYFEWAAGNQSATQTSIPYAARPRVVVGQVTRQTAGYGSGGSDANVNTYNAAIQSVVSELVSDGLNITIVNTIDAINQTTDMADAIHPDDSGHEKLARVFLDGATR